MAAAMHLIDRNAQTNRFRRLPAIEKLVFALGAMIVALGTESFCAEGAILVVAVGVVILGARVTVSDLWRAAQVPVGFIVIGTLTQATSIALVGWVPHLSWPEPAVAQAAFVGLRSLACVAALLGLALTTPLSDILHLLRRTGLGRDLGDIAFMMLRLSWVTLDCLAAGAQSQANRLGFVGYRRTMRSLGLLLAALLPRTLGRAQRLEVGLAARGYDGTLRFIRVEHPVSVARLGIAGVILAAVAAVGTVTV